MKTTLLIVLLAVLSVVALKATPHQEIASIEVIATVEQVAQEHIDEMRADRSLSNVIARLVEKREVCICGRSEPK